jgi:hypothetical protein
LDSDSYWQPNAASKYLTPLTEYKDTVDRLFPMLERRILDNCSIYPVDAMILGYFLEYYPSKAVVVLEIGAFVGASAFCFASHPKVSKVISVDPNPFVSDELAANSDVWIGRTDFEPLKGLRVLDVARTTFAEFDAQNTKIQFCEGVVGSTHTGAKEGFFVDETMRIDVPTVDSSEDISLVAMVDGLHTREGVQADLAAIFDRNPSAVVLLDDCRHDWGPAVQAGAVSFMEQATGEYHFRLIGDLGPGLATSNLGIICPSSGAAGVNKALNELKLTFSQRLDPLRLLVREGELIATINWHRQKLQEERRLQQEIKEKQQEIKEKQQQTKQQLQKRTRKLQQIRQQLQETTQKLQQTNQEVRQTTQQLQQTKQQLQRIGESKGELESRISSRRYKAADAVAERVLRIPGVRGLFRQKHV